ncbi:mCG1027735 [Mus musculus]|nr:mCG1027735 [Mus musculus]
MSPQPSLYLRKMKCKPTREGPPTTQNKRPVCMNQVSIQGNCLSWYNNNP